MRTGDLTLAYAYALAGTAAAALALSPLPRFSAALLAVAALAGMLWDRVGRRRAPPLLLTVAGLAAFLANLFPLSRETLAEQSLAALAALLAVKLLGPKRRRDHLQILAVALMIVAGAASLEPELGFAALFLATLALGVCQLLWLPFAERSHSAPAALARRLAGLGVLLTALSLPASLVIFVVLPRSLNPFWTGLAFGRGQGVSGVSDQLRLGEVGRVALSGALAFRAELLDLSGPLPTLPYWRGTVLEVTDGRRWLPAEWGRPSSRTTDGAGTRITYFVEPHGQRQLFLLETPASAAISARVQGIGARRALRLPAPLARRIRYQGVSVPADRYPERLTPEERALNLRLPAGLSPRLVELARSLAAGETGEPAVARRLLSHFGRGFTYSLEVPPPTEDPLEDFLFRHRQGYCEYFATSLALLLRAAGVPARVVGGFLGGEYVAAGNYYRVTQAEAHAWVEAYLEGHWQRLDPTPGTRELGGTFASRRSPRTRLWLDALRMRWNSWVIQYDAESQLALARRGAGRLRAVRPGAAAGFAAAAAAALALAALAARTLNRPRRPPLERRIGRFEALAARAGAPRRAHEGPLDHGGRFARARPGRAPEIRRFAALAAACRYGGRPADPGALAELDRLLARIRGGR